METWSLDILRYYSLLLFYFSLIDKISLSDLSQRLGIGKSELITLALQLMKVLNLNMSYDPVDKLFVRSQSKYPTQDLSSIVKNLENYIQATMIQNTVLKALEEWAQLHIYITF